MRIKLRRISYQTRACVRNVHTNPIEVYSLEAERVPTICNVVTTSCCIYTIFRQIVLFFATCCRRFFGPLPCPQKKTNAKTCYIHSVHSLIHTSCSRTRQEQVPLSRIGRPTPASEKNARSTAVLCTRLMRKRTKTEISLTRLQVFDVEH